MKKFLWYPSPGPLVRAILSRRERNSSENITHWGQKCLARAESWFKSTGKFAKYVIAQSHEGSTCHDLKCIDVDRVRHSGYKLNF